AARPIAGFAEAHAPGVYFLAGAPDTSAVPAERLPPVERGRVAVAALAALHQLSARAPLAVVTGPIDNHACSLAGFAYPGQTEYFAALWSSPSVMVLAGPRLRVALVTNHVA